MSNNKKTKGKKTALEGLTPNAFVVNVKGEELRVAANKEENTIMNMILASQMRGMIQRAIENYKDDDVKLTPKEIRDLAGAARDVASFSAEIYGTGNPLDNAPTKASDNAPEILDIAFDNLHTPPEIKKEDGNQPEPTDQGDSPEAGGK